MKRLIGCTFVWLTLALSLAHAVPARPLYEPAELPKAPPPIVLQGTTWIGKLYADGEQVTFPYPEHR